MGFAGLEEMGYLLGALGLLDEDDVEICVVLDL